MRTERDKWQWEEIWVNQMKGFLESGTVGVKL